MGKGIVFILIFTRFFLLTELPSIFLKDTINTTMPENQMNALSGTTPPDDFLLQIFLDNTDDSYIFIDCQLKVRGFNNAANERVRHYFHKNISVNTSLLDLTFEHKRAAMAAICAKALSGERVVEEHLFVTESGESKWFQKTFRPAKDAQDKMVGIIFIAKDITATKLKEEELRHINERYELISKATSDVIWDFDIASRQVYFNDCFTRYFGHPIHKMEEAFAIWKSNLHPEDTDRVSEKINQSFDSTDSFWEDEYRFRHADGSYAYVYARGLIIRNADGKAVRIIGSMQDVSRQKENELKIALSEHRFRSLVQSGTDLIGIVTEAGIYTYVSPTVEQLGYSIDFLLGKCALDFYHPDDIIKAQQCLANVYHQHQVTLPPLRFKHGNGEWRWIETVITNMLNDPAIKGIVANSRDITEKKRKDEVLQKTLNDLNRILDSSADVIVVTDEQNRYVVVSAAAAHIWGYTPDELIGRVCLELVHPDDLEMTRVMSDNVMAGTQITNFQNRYIRKNGSVVSLIWSAKWDDQEKVMYSIARDATEKQQAEKALKESEKNYRYLFQNNPLPVYAFDLETLKFVTVNQAAIEFYGYTREEFCRISILDIRPEKEHLRLKEIIQQVKQEEGARRLFGWKHRKKDGTVVDVETFGHNIDIDGKQCRLVVINDVTETVKARTALQKSEAMFRAISESFPNGIVSILDKEMRFVYIAGKELEMLGLQPAQFIGTLYSEHIPDEDQQIRVSIEKLFQGEAMVSELNFLHQNYLLSSVPLHEPDGSIQRVLVVAQNISAQKLIQKEKELLINELTKNIQDLRQFSYITSHNLRAPISNLIGIMNLIDMSAITDQDTAFLVEKFKESTFLLNETVNDLLSILLIKNNVNVRKEIFALQQVWQHVCTSVNVQIKKSGAVINADFASGTEVAFNKSYAESILLNLLTNSIKYRHPHRQLCIELKAHAEDDYLVLHFADNGIGINLDHHRHKIFGLYQRFHNYPDSKGLGLYIVHSQITALGGKIEVESEVDKGTRFKVYFKR